MKTIAQLQQQARQALGAAQKAGARQALVDLSVNRRYSIKTKNDDVELLKETASVQLYLRLYIDHRFGAFSTSDVQPGRVAEFARKAVEMVKLTDRDEAHGLPDPRYTKPLPADDLQLHDPVIARSKKAESRQICAAMTRAAREAGGGKVMHVECGFRDAHHRSVLLTTEGFEASRESTRASMSCSTWVKDGARKQRGTDHRAWRHWSDVDHGPIGPTAARRALALVGSAPLPTGEYPLVIVNYWGDKLTGMLLRALQGRAIYRKMSCLRGKAGQRVASEVVTLTDDPLVTRGLGSRRYDYQGVVARELPLVERGVLRNYLYNCFWARKQGVEPTTSSATNVVFAPGRRSGEQMVAALDRGLFITDFIGGNFNATSGDFSVGIRGFLVEQGKRTRPVTEMNLAGNLLTVLPKIVEVGNDPYPFMSIRSPAMRLSPLTVSGT